jgi:hypothetical protein
VINMKCHNIAVYIIIPLALFSIMSLLDDAQAQPNSSSSTNQTISQQQQQQQNQNANLTAQALMKTDRVALKDNLEKAKLAIVEGNIEQALKDVIDLETQLLKLEPSPPTKFLNNIHKAIGAIAKSDIDKSLNTLTNIEVSILKAENLIFKAAVANPQEIQQFHTLNNVIENPQPQQMQKVDTSKNVVPTPQPEKIQQVDTLKNVVTTPQPQEMQQFKTLESNNNTDDLTSIEDS